MSNYLKGINLKNYYTEQEMLDYMKKHFPRVKQEIKIINGFNCRHHFCELEKGWYPTHSVVDEYELFMVMKYTGSIQDRKKWNKYSNSKLTTNKKELVKENKAGRISKRKHKNARKSHKYDRKGFENFIKSLKRSGVPTLRRTKKERYKGLFYFHLNKDREILDFMSGEEVDSDLGILYIPNEKGYPFIGMDVIESLEDLVSLVNGKNGKQITVEDIKNKRFRFYNI